MALWYRTLLSLWGQASCGVKLLNQIKYLVLGVPASIFVAVSSSASLIFLIYCSLTKNQNNKNKAIFTLMLGLLFASSLLLNFKIKQSLGMYSAQALVISIISAALLIAVIWAGNSNVYPMKKKWQDAFSITILLSLPVCIFGTHQAIASTVVDVASRKEIDALRNSDLKSVFAFSTNSFGELSGNIGFIVFSNKECQFSPGTLSSLNEAVNTGKAWGVTIDIDLVRLEKIRAGEIFPISKEEAFAAKIGVNATPTVVLYKNSKFMLAKKRNLSAYL